MADENDTDKHDLGWTNLDWPEPDPIPKTPVAERSASHNGEHREVYWSEHDKEDYTCPDCGCHADDIRIIDVHHIDGDPENNDLDNLVGLCRRCHNRRHKRRNIQLGLEEMRREAEEMGDTP